MYENIDGFLGTVQTWLVCMTACRGHNGEPGISANGIESVSMLACRVWCMRKTVMPGGVMETSPINMATRLRSRFGRSGRLDVRAISWVRV